jgi:hypothetical protein
MGKSSGPFGILSRVLVLDLKSDPDPPIHTYSAEILPFWGKLKNRFRMEVSKRGLMEPVVPNTTGGPAISTIRESNRCPADVQEAFREKNPLPSCWCADLLLYLNSSLVYRGVSVGLISQLPQVQEATASLLQIFT